MRNSTGLIIDYSDWSDKTSGKHVTIPVHDEVEKILEKYNGDFPPTFGRSTHNSNATAFNLHIKKVCELSVQDLIRLLKAKFLMMS